MSEMLDGINSSSTKRNSIVFIAFVVIVLAADNLEAEASVSHADT